MGRFKGREGRENALKVCQNDGGKHSGGVDCRVDRVKLWLELGSTGNTTNHD